MENNFFEKNYNIHYYETDPRQQLRISNLMNYFEEVALPPELLRNNQLENIKIVFKKETTYGQRISSQVEVHQEPGGTRCVHRIVDEQGREVCALLTSWKPA